MNDSKKKDEILRSWRRCMEQNLLTKSNAVSVDNEKIEMILHKNRILISVFEGIVNDIVLSDCLFLYYRTPKK